MPSNRTPIPALLPALPLLLLGACDEPGGPDFDAEPPDAVEFRDGQASAITGDVFVDDYVCDGTQDNPRCYYDTGSGWAWQPDHGGDYAQTIRYILEHSDQCKGVGCTIRFGRGVYDLESRLTICRAVRLVGVGGGATPTNLPGSRLKIHPPAAGEPAGIKVAFSQECADDYGNGSGAGTVIEHLGICTDCSGGVDPNGPYPADPVDGLLLEARATVRDVRIRGFFRHGIHLTADAVRNCPGGGCADGQWLSEASNWRLEDVVIDYTTDEGVYIHGGDTNTGVAMNLSVKSACLDSTPECAFIHDDGFIGNTHLGHHVDGTDAPPSRGYNIEGDSHTIVGAYAESGFSGGHLVSQHSIALGGKSVFSGGGLSISSSKIRHAELEAPVLTTDTNGVYMEFEHEVGDMVSGSNGFYLRELNQGGLYGIMGTRYRAGGSIADRGWYWFFDDDPAVQEESFIAKLKGTSVCNYGTGSCPEFPGS